MPGLHKKFDDYDQSTWTISNWIFAFRWNIGFLIGWCLFFAFPLVAVRSASNGIVLVIIGLIAVFGIILQVVNLWRIRQTIAELKKKRG